MHADVTIEKVSIHSEDRVPLRSEELNGLNSIAYRESYEILLLH